MQVTTPREAALAAQIQDAFGQVSAPRREEMLHSEYAGNEDAGALVMAFLGKHWAEVPLLDLFWHRESLFMLSPVGYRAYLPAYLSAALAKGEPHNPDVCGYMLYSLRPSRGYSKLRKDTTRERLALLDARQRAAVLAIVRYLADEGASDAVDVLRGWESSFLGEPDRAGGPEPRADQAMTRTETALAAQLRDAFDDVVAPRSEEMILPEFEDNDEPYLMTLVFQGTHWAKVPLVDLFVHRGNTFALSPAGCRAVLPAYLAAALARDERFGDGSEIWAPVLHGLLAQPDDDETIAARARERLLLLDAEQRAAVLAILRYLADERGSSEAADVLRALERSPGD